MADSGNLPIVVETLPGGFTQVLSGGTRGKINLSRPTQAAISSMLAATAGLNKCPFETKPQNDLPLPEGSPKGWRLLNNLYTPHTFEAEGWTHKLIIPENCWEEGDLRVLGGEDRLAEWLTVASLLKENGTVAFFIHVGPSMGQNLYHAHGHHLHHRRRGWFDPEHAIERLTDERIIYVDGTMTVGAMGIRAGSCIAIPNQTMVFSPKMAGRLSEVITGMVTLCNEKFRSTAGLKLSPEYSLTVAVDDGAVDFVSYDPYLNPWGAPEMCLQAYYGTPFTKAWPDSRTAAYLRGEINTDGDPL